MTKETIVSILKTVKGAKFVSDTNLRLVAKYILRQEMPDIYLTLLMLKYNDIHGIIAGGVDWLKSDEGPDYWASLHRDIYHAMGLDPLEETKKRLEELS